ncbi:helix-turn-helix domain-containing protein [Plebeiibacterium sediminum]|uniref:Helix-turn-helix domain-containing protein n=1 Tax=Plebeiibacterium sediminum TaxID=2992112 RepID=A0AAE3M5Q3_9BACT|nr:helix-turn-helix domain-containing protein [Plebeiobacterium sediminum]MCW3787310.1 helix-turn-helix domain-containing protein [Plebeiobacterium sediminum]
MKNTFKVDSISEYNDKVGQETFHPLISIVDLSKLKPSDPELLKTISHFKLQMNIYAIFIKDSKCGNITYGISNYDYKEGTLIFVSPGQVFGLENNEEFQNSSGTAILFHPDLIYGTPLAKHMNDYSFFSYDVNEALHISKRERNLLNECISLINFELQNNIDNHSNTIIVSSLELFLNYCNRFYERQFITRNKANKDVLARFEKLLKDYFASEQTLLTGLPTVNYLAKKLCISPNYLGDLLRKVTGKSAIEHIQLKVIDVAKEKIFDNRKTISEIAYELGFKHPQHFTRMFKKSIGVSPTEYRNLN